MKKSFLLGVFCSYLLLLVTTLNHAMRIPIKFSTKWLTSPALLVAFFTIFTNNALATTITPTTLSPSAAFAAAICGTCKDLGQSAPGAYAHTFTGLPSNITAASLTFRVEGDEFPNLGAETDGINLGFTTTVGQAWTTSDAIVWTRTFGVTSLGVGNTLFPASDNGLLKPGTTWNHGDDVTFTVDLSNAPLAGGGTVNLLGLMETHGFLDVVVHDDSIVHSYSLNFVPVPASVWLFGSGLLGLIGVSKRKKAV